MSVLLLHVRWEIIYPSGKVKGKLGHLFEAGKFAMSEVSTEPSAVAPDAEVNFGR